MHEQVQWGSGMRQGASTALALAEACVASGSRKRVTALERKIARLWGLHDHERMFKCGFDLVRSHNGECRAIIDVDNGRWEHPIPQSAYKRFLVPVA